MLVRLIRWILGYVTFSFSKGFGEDFVDDCFKHQIRLYNITYDDNGLRASCSPRTYLTLHSIARAHGGVVKIIKRHGVLLGLLSLRSRMGLITGLLASVVILCTLTGFVWDIEIVGNEKISDEEILMFLDREDFHIGVLWRARDKSILEDLLMASFDDISWVHINHLGSTVRVEIQEATRKPTLEDKAITNLVATKDGVIVSAMVRDGWQLAQVGDSVTKGEILVSGVNSVKEQKENFYAHASGDFIAQVEDSFSLTVNREQTYRVYGAEKDYRAIRFFGLYLPLYFGRIPSQDTVKKATSSYLKINSRQIPIGITTTVVTPFVLQTRSLCDRELNSIIQKQIKYRLASQYPELISKDIKVSINSTNAVARGKVVALENIAREHQLIAE